MSERVLDSSDDQWTLVLVVSMRILRDPVLALDATNEALAERPTRPRLPRPPVLPPRSVQQRLEVPPALGTRFRYAAGDSNPARRIKSPVLYPMS